VHLSCSCGKRSSTSTSGRLSTGPEVITFSLLVPRAHRGAASHPQPPLWQRGADLEGRIGDATVSEAEARRGVSIRPGEEISIGMRVCQYKTAWPDDPPAQTDAPRGARWPSRGVDR